MSLLTTTFDIDVTDSGNYRCVCIIEGVERRNVSISTCSKAYGGIVISPTIVASGSVPDKVISLTADPLHTTILLT
ncbi:MAG: hypothetical protein IPP89_14260 [Saprospiraceae bacterium]|nr:hypothetical protein [Candidatus Brachybacter algidus]MBL0120100.1 hypothetical protein [Candidatus Brachybacter algidus]